MKKDAPKAVVVPPVDHQGIVMTRALNITGGVAAVYGMGLMSPDAAFSNMFTTFTLACISGYYTVWGVVPALHSPLMSVTNAISGMTAAGGMLLCSGGLVPNSLAGGLAAASVAMSSINIVGGFIITQRMLDMFKVCPPNECLCLFPLLRKMFFLLDRTAFFCLSFSHRALEPEIFWVTAANGSSSVPPPLLDPVHGAHRRLPGGQGRGL